jgi:hypothetical protein
MRPLSWISLVVPALLVGCADPEFDTSSPQKAVDAVREMLVRDRPDLLATMIHVEAESVVFEDGVTEASAIENVREKLGDMLTQLWRVSRKLQERFPAEVEQELNRARDAADERGWGERLAAALANPFAFLDEQQGLLHVEDLGDGTAILSYDGEPVFENNLTMIETSQGWRFNLPLDLVRQSRYWPQTRHEWSVIASMILAVENSLTDFEAELDRGELRSLGHASERAGRLIGESVVVQSIIYGSMARSRDKAAREGALPK